MTSNWQGQHILRGPQQSRKNSAWGIALGITLFGVFLSASASANIFVVNSSADTLTGDANPGDGICDGLPPLNICTLRAAIQEANALPGDDTIILPPNTYLLTQVAELTITSNVAIVGSGAASTFIDGNKSVRTGSGVLRIDSGTVSISGVTIQNGARNNINPDSGGGGGIMNGGKTTLINSTVRGNRTTGDGGGIYTAAAGGMTLINSTVNANDAVSAGSTAGGIFSRVGGIVTITNSTVSGNSAAFGGGIYNSGTIMLTNSTVSGNSASVNGGGIYNVRALILISGTVSGNSASVDGGGIFNDNFGTLTLTSSTVSGNSASVDGGGIFNDTFGTLTLTNSTVSGNRANSNGGGIVSRSTKVNSFSSTITDNLADANLDLIGVGGGVYVDVGQGGTFNFQNTILAGNFRRVFDLISPRAPSDCAGTINPKGNNLIQSVDGCTTTGLVRLGAPQLGPLQNNGGPTQTHAPLPGSPAIDLGSDCQDNLGAPLATDQRGFPRSIDGDNDGVARCDIGAYEVFTGSNTSVVAALLPSSRSVQVGTAATVFGTMINVGQSIAAACSITLPSGIPATFQFQTTNPVNNQVTGFPNTAASIAAGAAQSFILAITPTAPFPPTDVQFSFDCANTEPAPINTGLNTLLLSASNTPVPDIVALAATPPPDPGIVNVPGATGTGAFAVATVNVGASAAITASADTGGAVLPVNVFLCETNPSTGQCISGIGPSVSTTINAGATPTFGIFVQGNGNVPFDPAANRIFVRFKDGGGVTRGSTSVAVRTQ